LKPLLLSYHGLSLTTKAGSLVLRNRITETREAWAPSAFPFDSVVVEATGGYVTWDALRWLATNDVSVTLLQFNGKPASVTLPDSPVQARDRLAQLRAHADPERRLEIARAFVAAKVRASVRAVPDCAWAAVAPRRMTLSDLLLYEGRVAEVYWRGRGVVRDYPNARDPANAVLNYAYGLLESRARLVVHRLSLEPSVGFLHQPRETKSSFVYDVMEPWRTEADDVALGLLPSLKRVDFLSSFGHGLRLRPHAAGLLVKAFAERMNTGVEKAMLRATGRLALCFAAARVTPSFLGD
jgi:CRISP-associated protein Cas1